MQRHASLHKAKRNIKRVDTEVRALKRFSHAAVVRLCDVIQSPAHVGAAAASATEHEMSKPSNLRSLRHRAPSSLYPAAAATKA